MNDEYDPEHDYDHEGLCEAIDEGEGWLVTNCALCGKELVAINGLWYTWDHYLYENPVAQGIVK